MITLAAFGTFFLLMALKLAGVVAISWLGVALPIIVYMGVLLVWLIFVAWMIR